MSAPLTVDFIVNSWPGVSRDRADALLKTYPNLTIEDVNRTLKERTTAVPAIGVPAKKVTFSDRAAEGLKHGIPVIPALPRDKKTVVGAKAATTDPSIVGQWNSENPDANSAFVAQAEVGGVWILDCDSSDVIDQFEKDTGKTFPDTFKVRSSKGGHRYFRQNEESLKRLKNFSVHRDGKEFFSVRWDNQYCIGSLSVHPSGAIYTTVSDLDPIEAPTFVIDWLLEEDKRYNSPSSATAATANTTDEDAPIPEGARDVTLTSIAGKLYRDGLDEEEVHTVLSRINRERCTPPLDDSQVKKIAHSIAGTGRPRKTELEANFDAGFEQRAAAAKAQAEQKAQVQTVLDVSNWRQEFKSVGELEKGEVRMLINNFLPEGTTFIGGLPGEGKTLLALSMAKALTTGEDFLGCAQFDVPVIVPVLYLIPEVAARAFRQRCEKFHIPDDPNLFLCRTISEGPTLLLDNPTVLEAVKRMKPVVFLDTVLRFNQAEDENAASQNRALVEDLIRLRHEGAVAIVGLHHSTKNMHKEGMSLETVLRGTGDLAAMCDAVYGLLRDDALYKHNSGPNEIDVACVKPRDFEPPEPFRIAASHRVNELGIIGTALGIVSYIDELGDFQMVSKAETERAIGDWLESVVTDDPAITLAELEKSTKLSSWVIRQTLKNRGWMKARGGAKGASQWRKSNPSNPEGGKVTIYTVPERSQGKRVSF